MCVVGFCLFLFQNSFTNHAYFFFLLSANHQEGLPVLLAALRNRIPFTDEDLLRKLVRAEVIHVADEVRFEAGKQTEIRVFFLVCWFFFLVYLFCFLCLIRFIHL